MDPRPYHYEYRKPRLSNPTFQSGRLYESIYHMGSFTRMNANVDKITNNFVSPSETYLNYKLNPQMPKQRNYPKETITNDQKIRQDDRYNNRTERRNDYANINNYQSARYNERLPAPRANNDYAPQRNSLNLRQNKPSSQERQYQKYPTAMDSYERRSSIDQNQKQTQQRRQPIQARSSSQQTPSTASKQDAYMSNYGSRLIRALPGKDQDFVYERQQKPYNIISCYPRQMSNAHRVYPKLTLESKLIETGQYPYIPNKNGSQRYLY